MAFAASSDLLTMTISNRLSLALAGGFFLLTLVTGMGLHAFGMHLAAAAVVLVVAFIFFSQGWIGGGDAKLAAATALWFGFGSFTRLSDLRVAIRWRTDAGDTAVPKLTAARRSCPSGLDCSPA